MKTISLKSDKTNQQKKNSLRECIRIRDQYFHTNEFENKSKQNQNLN